MCKHGIPATQVRLASSRSDGRTHAPVDPCIAPLVQALNDAGFGTVASCCGHGHRPGWIALEDGRQIMLFSSLSEMKRTDHLWPDIHGRQLPKVQSSADARCAALEARVEKLKQLLGKLEKAVRQYGLHKDTNMEHLEYLLTTVLPDVRAALKERDKKYGG